MTYIYWLPALLGYFSVAAFASFENFQTTRIEQSPQACVQNYQETKGKGVCTHSSEITNVNPGSRGEW